MDMQDLTDQLRGQFGPRFRIAEPMARHTNFRIGGPARYYFEARTTDEIHAAIDVARRAGVPWFILGGGSNTLVADAGYVGLVIHMALRDVRTDGTRMIAGAGAIVAAVARAAGDAGLTGFEWAVSLPGTIGGAVRGNAGCFGGEMKDVVERVHFFSPSRGEGEREGVGDMTNAQCGFAYRYSTFKEHPEWAILDATLALRPGDSAVSRAQMDEFLARRKTKQPLERPSAGCLFTNVEVNTLDAEQLERLEAVTNGAWRTVVHDDQLPTGWLIEHLGLKGYRVGNVMVSEKHGNFVINLGDGTAANVFALIDAVKTQVREAYGIEIKEEVQRLGL